LALGLPHSHRILAALNQDSTMINTYLPRLLLLIITVMLTGGCGQTGPLYMPDQTEEAQEPDSRPQPDT